MNLVKKAKKYAIAQHEKTNHKYGDKPYSYHLKKVYEVARRYIELIPEEEREAVLASCFTHDLIEDCRQNYFDVMINTSKRVADITYAVTSEKGKTRKERMGKRYFYTLLTTPYALFVKLCDRIANIEYSLAEYEAGKKTSKIKMYKTEHEMIKELLYSKKEYAILVEHIENLLARYNPEEKQ